jgi:Xaa-Pro aminopeptidase
MIASPESRSRRIGVHRTSASSRPSQPKRLLRRSRPVEPRPSAVASDVGDIRDALLADVAARVDLLREELDARRLDCLLVTKDVNVYYLSGFTGSESALLVGPRTVVLVTDFRYVEEAAASAPGVTVACRKGPLMAECVRQARRRGWTRLGYELAGMLAVDRDDLMRAARGKKGRKLRLTALRNTVEALRAVKSPAEVEAIRRAVGIAERAGAALRRRLRTGVSEIELARLCARRMEDLGADEPSFPVIAALDERASLPHAHPGEGLVRKRSALLLDWGATADRYRSDLTRVFAVSSIPSWLRRAHEAVLLAQREAVARAGPGVRAKDVDAAARGVLKSKGLGKRFGHGVGHGLGLEVHEAPRLAPRSKDVLRPGMVVTIEPGVYVPGRGGVRIEDDVLITEDGAEVLSRMARGLH